MVKLKDSIRRYFESLNRELQQRMVSAFDESNNNDDRPRMCCVEHNFKYIKPRMTSNFEEQSPYTSADIFEEILEDRRLPLKPDNNEISSAQAATSGNGSGNSLHPTINLTLENVGVNIGGVDSTSQISKSSLTNTSLETVRGTLKYAKDLSTIIFFVITIIYCIYIYLTLMKSTNSA
ncbi:hypothetical protein GWI33_017422 [Rhynchophorus ferrugineus]|uniref:Uncharacterized protein n=1 Tax=Rhynchophorus ferrugineus TaxID=354439 RepID=A0A834HZ92_RHYFE|nr:hypothetical protein GWI33_017422 [Rhynchophorus ferrugineus]